VTAAGLAAPAVAAWLLWRDGGWDTYRMAIFWPFVFATGVMVTVSSSVITTDPRSWRTFVVGAAVAAAVASAGMAMLLGQDPIYGIRTHDVVALALLAGLLVIAAGAATAFGERVRPGGWIKTAWCIGACFLVMAAIPRLLLLVH
jgi:hypothetical protein